MTGTAASMGIEENLALAKRRGKTRFLRSGITKAEREEYKELLKILNRVFTRRFARARFSSIPMVAAVPVMGSCNTRPR